MNYRHTIKVAALVALILLAYLFGSAIDEQRREETQTVELHREAQAAGNVAEAYRRGVADGEANERFRRSLQTTEASHE